MTPNQIRLEDSKTTEIMKRIPSWSFRPLRSGSISFPETIYSSPCAYDSVVMFYVMECYQSIDEVDGMGSLPAFSGKAVAEDIMLEITVEDVREIKRLETLLLVYAVTTDFFMVI